MPKKELVCSVTMKDIEIQTFCAGGPGGQKQNKTASAVRLIHHASGARAESRQHKSQAQNKKAALGRLANTKEFQKWARIQANKAAGREIDIKKSVDKAMQPQNLCIEQRTDGVWQKETTGEQDDIRRSRHDRRENGDDLTGTSSS